MAEHSSHSDSHAEHQPHHGGLGVYLGVFGALLVLTVMSFAVANSSLMETPKVAWALMMAISCGKALLVVTFFMHLLWEANWKYVLTIPATIMSVFLVLMLVPDIGMRTHHYSEERWLHAAEPQVATEGEGGAAHEASHADDHSAPEGKAGANKASAEH